MPVRAFSNMFSTAVDTCVVKDVIDNDLDYKSLDV